MEPDDNLSFYILLLLLLLLGSAFFTISEAAIISLNDKSLRRMAQEGHKRAGRIVAMVDRPAQFLASIHLGNALCGFFAAAIAAHVFVRRIVRALEGWTVHPVLLQIIALVCIALALVLVAIVLGEMVPKRLGAQYSENIAMAVAGPLSVIIALERPLVALLSAATGVVLRLIGLDPNQQPDAVTEEEIRMMIDVGGEAGSIQEGEMDMINNIFEFDDRTAEEMMTHRTEIVAVEMGAPLDEIINTALETGYSRIPVYVDSLDSICGILYVKDLLARVSVAPDAPFDLAAYMREPFYVLESTSGEALLADFQVKKIHMAIVVDEYGGTSGLVTMEDLLESIVGNIQDEYDNEEEDISLISEDIYEVDGLADLEEVAKFFHIEISEEDEEDFETIGGYIMGRLGSIPGEDEHPSVPLDGVIFTVSRMEERRIAKLRAEVAKIPQTEDA